MPVLIRHHAVLPQCFPSASNALISDRESHETRNAEKQVPGGPSTSRPLTPAGASTREWERTQHSRPGRIESFRAPKQRPRNTPPPMPPPPPVPSRRAGEHYVHHYQQPQVGPALSLPSFPSPVCSCIIPCPLFFVPFKLLFVHHHVACSTERVAGNYGHFVASTPIGTAVFDRVPPTTAFSLPVLMAPSSMATDAG